MALDIPKTAYNGKIRELTLGTGDKAVTVGGETSYPFHLFKGRQPHSIAIALEICDVPPRDWPEALLEPFGDSVSDPVTWAKKCTGDYKAELICLQLTGTDPNGENRSAAEAVEVVKQVLEVVDVPLIVWGTASVEKDAEVLTAVAGSVRNRQLIIGPVQEGNYKRIAPAAIAGGHIVIASSPIDVNLAKQLNIQLGNLGVPENALLMDPTVSSIGYGLEYCYSVMERLRMAALTQQDTRLQYPLLCSIGRETWKTKEARMPEEENPRMGDAARRGILMESMSAVLLVLAGADILIMRHPEAVRLTRETVNDLGR